MNILDKINSPKDLKKLNREDLISLCDEMRSFIMESVSKTGGHLSSNLGVIELTVALHYVFDCPNDKFIWDVGHQTYPHKILTGRKKVMGSLRAMNGISGFPKISESHYDIFGTGHSSTSISAALGMAEALKKKKKLNHKAIAIIGDGAMTAGMAFEGLNNAGDSDNNILVILNDNDMSISKNVGALNNYLAKLM
jgi:1-deoxy-D-xylulose-5-phosphate synthase